MDYIKGKAEAVNGSFRFHDQLGEGAGGGEGKSIGLGKYLGPF